MNGEERRTVKAVWALGFRPFFLLGLVGGTVALILWVSVFAGWGAWPIDLYWHAHEMIHGFAVAIIIGFLYTASQNWTGVRGVHGRPLMALALLWLAGRIALLIPTTHLGLVALVDLAFLPLAAGFLARYLVRAGQGHNLIFLVVLALLWVGNLAYHAERLHLSKNLMRPALYFSAHLISVMILVIAGRVVPFFTERAITGYTRRKAPALDRSIIVSALLFTIAYAGTEASLLSAALAFATAILALTRFALWVDARIARIPILWILYAAYAWAIVGFILTGLSTFGLVLPSAALHAFTAGAMGAAIIGMVSRVSLGHTGRPIHANRPILIAYVLVLIGGAMRVFGPILVPKAYVTLIVTAGLVWSGALILLLTQIASILVSPRPDGKEG